MTKAVALNSKIRYNMFNETAERAMPTLFRADGYRFFFFSDEHLPKHVHIEKSDKYMRVELETLRVTDNYQMTSKEIREAVRIVEKHKQDFMEVWNEYFNQ